MAVAAWILVLALMASIACELAASDDVPRDPGTVVAMVCHSLRMADLPIACNLDGASLAARRSGLLDEVLRRAASRETLPDGLRFTFPASSATLDLLTRAIDAERQCCRFLTFQLTIAADLGEFVLDLTGPPGTLDFLADLLSSA